MAGKPLIIAVLGAGNVGKSALIIQLVQNKFVEVYDPTIEDRYSKNVTVNGKTYNLDIWDTAGQEEYQSLLDGPIMKASAFVLVFSVTDKQSYDQIIPLRDKIYRLKDTEEIPWAIVGTKTDLEGDRQVDELNALNEMQWKFSRFTDLSTKDKEKVDKVFVDLVTDISDRETEPKSQKKKEQTEKKEKKEKNQVTKEIQTSDVLALVPPAPRKIIGRGGRDCVLL